MDQHSIGVRAYRWLVFALAAGYTIYHLFTGDYGNFGGPFRYLTFWALLMSFVSASRMLAFTEHRTDQDWSAYAMVTAVANGLVVFLYWRLYFIDPALVNGGGEILWWNEYYLHLMGPVLQWIDFLFILGGARKILRPLAGLALLILAYSSWIEVILQPLSIRPTGTVTSGLPYPFLNSMVLADRIGFYATTAVTGAVFLLVFWGLSAGMRRLRGPGTAAV